MKNGQHVAATKICTKCGEEKGLSSFSPNKRASMGVNNWCRLCYASYGKAYYEKTAARRRALASKRRAENAEKFNERGRAWREANPDYYRRRYLANRDEFAAKSRERYWSNPEEHVRAAVEWARRNKEKTVARNARRHARKKNAPGRGVSGDEWLAILDASCGLCSYCGMPAEKLEMDHIVPLVKGGAHDPENVAVACKSCNCSKRAKHLVVWMAERAAA